MFTFSAARADATFAVNPTVSENVAVISFAVLAVNSGPEGFFVAGPFFTADLTAVLVTFFAGTFFAALAMLLPPLSQ
jgi:hypothetical protein